MTEPVLESRYLSISFGSSTYQKSSSWFGFYLCHSGVCMHWPSLTSSNIQVLVRKEENKSIFLHVSLLHSLGLILRGSGKLNHWLTSLGSSVGFFQVESLTCKESSECQSWRVGTLRTSLAKILIRDWDLGSRKESSLSNVLVADPGLDFSSHSIVLSLFEEGSLFL